MSELQTRLRQGDPIGQEPALQQGDVERMRRLVLGTRRASETRRGVAWLAVAGAATISLTVAAFLAREGSQRPVAGPARVAVQTVPPDAGSGSPGQLHFVTRGGTRVIWIFNSEFEQ
jgi:hypothetical protein